MSNLFLFWFIFSTIFATFSYCKQQTSPKIEIMEHCKLTSVASLPNEYDGSMINMNVYYSFTKLTKVSDVDGVVVFTGGLFITFEIPCIRDTFHARYSNDSLAMSLAEVWMSTDVDNFWNLGIVHMNSLEDYGLNRDVYRVVMIRPIPGWMVHSVTGLYSTLCDLHFEKFPFDQQTCELRFGIWIPSSAINITGLYSDFFYGVDGLIPQNVGWSWVNSSTAVMPRNSQGIIFYEVIYSFTLQRKPIYFISNLLVPCLLLTMVQVGSFFLPPEGPERASFAITILLSFTVIQAQVMSAIPETPSTVYISVLIQGESISAMLVTCYSCLLCGWIESFSHMANRKILIRNKKVRICRIIDAIALFVVASALVGLNASVIFLLFN